MSDQPSNKVLLNDLRRVAKELGESPTAEQYRDKGEFSVSIFQSRFESWNQAKQEAELETYSNTGPREYTDEELLDDLRAFAAECEGAVTVPKYRGREGPDPDTLTDRFGSWNAAKEQAGLTPAHHNRRSYDSEQELLDDLQRVAEKLGEHPSSEQYRTHGEFHPGTLQRVFGGWNNAKEEAGIEVDPPDEYITPEELLDDLRRTAHRIGTTPSKLQYDRWGEYSHTLCQWRFGSWTNAVEAANLDLNIEIDIPEGQLLDDINNVASIVDGTPSVDDYREYGSYSLKLIYAAFNSWVNALTEAGYDWVSHEYSDEEILKSLREVADGSLAPRRSVYDEKGLTGPKVIFKRYGSWWAGNVAAGLTPRNRRPLSPEAIHEFHRTALDFEPHWRTYALLFQFTGLPTRLVDEFTADWVADRRRRNIIRVPQDVTKSGDPWLFQYPDTWCNPYTGEQEPTKLPETLDWFISNYDSSPRTSATFNQILKRIAREGNFNEYRRSIDHTNIGSVPDISADDLRMSLGVRLASQGIELEVIERRLGIGESNWGGDIEDCCLYAYVHRDANPDYYNPPDVVLDPV